mgnify:CR=1 FL=1
MTVMRCMDCDHLGTDYKCKLHYCKATMQPLLAVLDKVFILLKAMIIDDITVQPKGRPRR